MQKMLAADKHLVYIFTLRFCDIRSDKQVANANHLQDMRKRVSSWTSCKLHRFDMSWMRHLKLQMIRNAVTI